MCIRDSSIFSSINNGQIVISKNQNLEALSNIVIQNLGLEVQEKSDKENSYIFLNKVLISHCQI